MEITFRFGEVNEATYKNHRGEVTLRRFLPIRVRYWTSPHHEGPQWFLHAFDLEKNSFRDFALSGFINES